LSAGVQILEKATFGLGKPMSTQDEAYQFTVDLWRFFKAFAFSSSSHDDAFWQEVVQKANSLEDRYGANRSMHVLILDVIDALEEMIDGKR